MEASVIFEELLELSDKRLMAYLGTLKGPQLRNLFGRMNDLTHTLSNLRELSLTRQPISKLAENQYEDIYCDINIVGKILGKKKATIEVLIKKGKIKPLPHKKGETRRFIKADIIKYLEEGG